MRISRVFIIVAVLAFGVRGIGQELEPGAYSPAPVGINIALTAFTNSSGDLAFDAEGPLENGKADISTAVLGYIRTLGVAGQSASLTFASGYVRGSMEGDFLGEHLKTHRSGLADPRVRFAVNLLGNPALSLHEFARTPVTPYTLGASLIVVVPLGQYDPSRVINIGSNRWAFKPELGSRRTFKRWTFEAALGVWLFTENTDFFRGGTRAQDPIGSLQFHLIYTFKPRCWVAIDANYYSGGRTTINGRESPDEQKNSRGGVTFALPLNLQHSLKFTYSRGLITNIGAAFDSIGIAYQFVWGGH